jgi:hypothetical protein
MTTTVTIAQDSLVVEPTGLDKMWSLTSRIVVPLHHVRGATHDPGMRNAPKGWRGPGLRIGDKLAGTFHADGDRQFWNVDGFDDVVVIELADEDYQRLVLSVQQPRDLVDAINAAATG